MKSRILTVVTILTLLCPCAVIASDFEDEPTPIEQEDIRTLDQVGDEDSAEGAPTPVEQDDMKTIEQLNAGDAPEGAPTPIERDDMKTIDQLND